MWLVSVEGSRCSCCGWESKPAPKPVTATPARLVELGGEGSAASPHTPECIGFYTEGLAWYARRWPDRWRERPKSGRWWAWSQTRERFEFAETVRMPSRFWEIAPATATSPAVRGWLKSQTIRYAKSRRSA